METPRKFKTSLFGYKKKFVNAYIMECAQTSEKTKIALETKNKELEEINSSLEAKISTLEKERAYIADALLNAKLEAEKMLEEARLESAKMRSGLELELEELRSKVRAEKSRIDEIREDAKSALSEYITRLDAINIVEEEEEAEDSETENDDDDDDDDL